MLLGRVDQRADRIAGGFRFLFDVLLDRVVLGRDLRAELLRAFLDLVHGARGDLAHRLLGLLDQLRGVLPGRLRLVDETLH